MGKLSMTTPVPFSLSWRQAIISLGDLREDSSRLVEQLSISRSVKVVAKIHFIAELR
jgi:hypothetical protein